MIVPLIKVTQKKEHIYLSKMKVKDLKKYVVLNFRYPYLESLSNSEQKKFNDYLKSIDRKGLNVTFGNQSIQRKLQLSKLKSIAEYVKQSNNFIPNAIILGCFNKLIEEGTQEYDYESMLTPIGDLGMYSIELDDNYELTAIDGQHRLAGLFSSDDPEIDMMELPVVLLFGVSLSTSAKIFIDINSNQKSVDKSLIYDLMPVLDSNNEGMKLQDREIENIQRCHKICITLYNNEKSPFYKQIRMLGTGKGAVSQAFLVEEIYPLIHDGVLSNLDTQQQFNTLYNYFKSIQEIFPNDWPVSKDVPNPEEYARFILNEKKSQLPKTLGVGALLKSFPFIYTKVSGKLDSSSFLNNKEYNKAQRDLFKEYIGRLKGKIAWSKVEYDEEKKRGNELIYVSGTNRSAINKLAAEINQLLNQ